MRHTTQRGIITHGLVAWNLLIYRLIILDFLKKESSGKGFAVSIFREFAVVEPKAEPG
jgi:hypothetical protein